MMMKKRLDLRSNPSEEGRDAGKQRAQS